MDKASGIDRTIGSRKAIWLTLSAIHEIPFKRLLHEAQIVSGRF